MESQMLSIGGLYYVPKVFNNGWVWVISNMNPMANLFIYTRHQKEVKIGLKALITCKEMAPNVGMWVVEPPNKVVPGAQNHRGKNNQIHPLNKQVNHGNDHPNHGNGTKFANKPTVVVVKAQIEH